MKYRYYVLFVGLLILLVVTVVLWKARGTQQKLCVHCNILLLDIDILRADELPCYGYFRNTAPNICSFAKKSVMFNDNYSNANWTLPSIFSTITSLYPTFHQVNMFTDKLSSTIPTLAETLSRAGYQTVYVTDYINDNYYNPSALTHENGGLRGYDYVTNQPLEQVISDLSKSPKPWFIHVYRDDLHLPYVLPENAKPMENMDAPKRLPITQSEYDRLLNVYLKNHYTDIFQQNTISQYRSIIVAPDKPNDTSVADLFWKLHNDKNQPDYLKDGWLPIFNTYMQSFDPTNSKDVAYIRMLYDTKIHLFDQKLETLFRTLNSEPLSKNTITVIMSDHGEAFGEHGTFSHDDNHHTELYYTPLIIHAPQSPSKSITQASSNMDILPTLLELTGIKNNSELQGHSLVSYINGNNNSYTFIMSEDNLNGIILQNKNWLYYLPGNATSIEQSELNHKVTDKLERNNVAISNQDLTQSLYEKASLMRSYMSNTKKLPNNNVIKLDPEKVKRLQKEGYF